ncbi:MAG: RimK family alpha-L-glutamate ligase [Planctomycetes bacterium]|nr:RimK family alpha-L-glutamate ligase [Planctomycetota bacterium]
MRLVFLGSDESWYLRDLQRAAANRHQLVAAPFATLRGELQDTGLRVHSGSVNLSQADAVLVRTMPPGSLEQVVVRMDLLQRLEATGVAVFNRPRAIEAAVDKFLTSARLQAAGLTVPRTFACQTADDALAAFESLGHDAVVKPLFGAEGRGITRINDAAMAERCFTLLERLGAVIYLQQFVPHHGHDLRLFVLGEQVFGMRRVNPDDWRTNISRGARGESFDVDESLAELAVRAARSVGADLAGVDFLPGLDGTLYAIEVNAVPGWRALARVTGVDIAALVLDYVAERAGKSPAVAPCEPAQAGRP